MKLNIQVQGCMDGRTDERAKNRRSRRADERVHGAIDSAISFTTRHLSSLPRITFPVFLLLRLDYGDETRRIIIAYLPSTTWVLEPKIKNQQYSASARFPELNKTPKHLFCDPSIMLGGLERITKGPIPMSNCFGHWGVGGIGSPVDPMLIQC